MHVEMTVPSDST